MAGRTRSKTAPRAQQTAGEQYYGSGVIASRLKVDPSAISHWMNRFKDTVHPFPTPDIEIKGVGERVTYGWSKDKVDKAIPEWFKQKWGVRPKGPVPGSRRVRDSKPAPATDLAKAT
jgi:hypothetical protein